MRGFVINVPNVDRPEPPTKALVADRRLYLAGDEQTVVEHGHTDARFLLAAEGMSIPGSDVDRLGLAMADGRVVQRREEPAALAVQDPEAEQKQSAPDADKQDSPEGDKQSRPDADKQASPQGDKSDKSKREKK